MQERVNAISTELLFFTLELNRLEDDELEAELGRPGARRATGPGCATCAPSGRTSSPTSWSGCCTRSRSPARADWSRLFDETMAGAHFQGRGKELTLEPRRCNLLSDRDGGAARGGARRSARCSSEQRATFALITNTLAKDKEVEDRWRKFPHPISSRHLANEVEAEVVDALNAAVGEAYPEPVAPLLPAEGQVVRAATQLDHWDRNAPLPSADDRDLRLGRGQDDGARRPTAPSRRELADGRPALLRPRAGSTRRSRPGKAPGAFAHPTVPSAHPYLLLNYMGKARDVMTLAHELGHGVHQILAAPQGALLADTPLTLAETASVFGEMLAFRALLAARPIRAPAQGLLAGKVEDRLNTVVRQIAFHQLRDARPRRARARANCRRNGSARSGWRCRRESLGPALRLNAGYGTTGPTSGTSSTRRSTSTPMPSAIAW